MRIYLQETKQNDKVFYNFVIYDHDFFGKSYIKQLTSQLLSGEQREYDHAHAKRIAESVKGGSPIPGSLLINIEVPIEVDEHGLYYINVKESYEPHEKRPFRVIDGQHRRAGLSIVKGECKSISDNWQWEISALNNASDADCMAEFIKRNGDSKKIHDRDIAPRVFLEIQERINSGMSLDEAVAKSSKMTKEGFIFGTILNRLNVDTNSNMHGRISMGIDKNKRTKSNKPVPFSQLSKCLSASSKKQKKSSLFEYKELRLMSEDELYQFVLDYFNQWERSFSDLWTAKTLNGDSQYVLKESPGIKTIAESLYYVCKCCLKKHKNLLPESIEDVISSIDRKIITSNDRWKYTDASHHFKETHKRIKDIVKNLEDQAKKKRKPRKTPALTLAYSEFGPEPVVSV